MSDTLMGDRALGLPEYSTDGRVVFSYTDYDPSGAHKAAMYSAFINSYKGDVYSVHWSFSVEGSLVDVVEGFRGDLDGPTVVEAMNEQSFHIKSHSVLLVITDCAANADPWESAKRNCVIRAWGDGAVLRKVQGRAKSFPKISNPRIKWNYFADGRRQEAVVFAAPTRPTPDAFYPYLKSGLAAYIRSYMESDATVLLLRGEPGTGKTAFVQNLIWAANADSMITYEERLFHSDEMFVGFITDDTTSLLIMEDADQMLLSREDHDNQIMAKFLNVSDGLFRFPSKKIIISTNLVDTSRVDHALLRPGRCFDAPVFRPLTYEESIAAAKAAGKPPPTEPRDYSLAEVLADHVKPVAKTVVGFARR